MSTDQHLRRPGQRPREHAALTLSEPGFTNTGRWLREVMSRVEMDAIEILRAAMTAAIKPPFVVTDKGTQYWCDEDSAFFTEIDVQHPVDQFVLIVARARPDPRLNEFLQRTLHHRAPEVWLIDDDGGRVIALHVGHDAIVLERGDTLVSRQLPSVRIAVAELFPR